MLEYRIIEVTISTMSERNADLVKDLKYSDEVKGYLAANIELDKAMEFM